MINSKSILITGLTAGIAAVISFLYLYHIPHSRDDFKDETRYLIVKRGESLSNVADHLEELGAISSKTSFVLFGKLLGNASKMKTGRYAVEPSYSMADIMGIITRGEAAPFNVTLPEGYTLVEIGRSLENTIGLDIDDFKEAIDDTAIFDSLGIEADNLEGYMAPSTYNFFYEEEAGRVVEKMTEHFFSSLPDSFEIKANRLGLTFHEAVTLASLIEEEAMRDSERPVIASVFLNRLKKRMRLECDPTVIYAMGGLDRPLRRKDLKYESPYNTYQVSGLPPGPISNPGVKSLEAAVNPANDKYLFFVARGDGSHQFTYTFRDHTNAVNRIKRARRNR
ncbi:MAG: endolytic transglycosylase MltG [candidate division Zixibacteria bacterium]